MVNILLVYAAVEQEVPFYNQNWFSAVASIVSAIIGGLFTHWLTNRVQKANDRKNFLLMITQNYNRLFTLIYTSTISGKVNHINLKKQLEESNIIFFLPKDIREPFEKLYRIYFTVGNDGVDNIDNIVMMYLKQIVEKLNEYGVNFIEDR